jgi:predicted DNA-binding ribbon-helix-helix protein
MSAPPDATNAGSLAADAEPVFRVVEHQQARRGIRLERLYWDTLRGIAQANGQKLGALVNGIIGGRAEQANATSLLRVYCLKALAGDLARTRWLASPSLVANLVRASPAAAFAIGLDKRIVAYNQAFLNFVQARFSYTQQGPIGKDLRLTLDVQLADLAAALETGDNAPKVVGFVVGVGERGVRGNLNVLLAPVVSRDILLCYVLP